MTLLQINLSDKSSTISITEQQPKKSQKQGEGSPSIEHMVKCVKTESTEASHQNLSPGTLIAVGASPAPELPEASAIRSGSAAALSSVSVTQSFKTPLGKELAALSPEQTSLNFSYRRFTPEEWRELSLFLEITTITKLSLVGCFLIRSSIEILIPGLAKNKSLVELDLRWNRIGDEEIKCLVDGNALHTTLHTLTIDIGSFKTKGVETLTEWFLNSSLHTLNLNTEYCTIKLTALIKALLACPLKVLKLHSMICEEDTILLASLLPNSNLSTFHLEGDNFLSPTGSKALIEALKRRPLDDFKVSSNYVELFSDGFVEAFGNGKLEGFVFDYQDKDKVHFGQRPAILLYRPEP